MASSKKGSDGFTGKTGRTVVYLLNGKIVKREIGFSSKPPSILQLAAWQVTTISSQFLSPAKEFINLGFKLQSEKTYKSPNSLASSHLRYNAVIGEYPDYCLDYSKVLLSRGTKPLTERIEVEVVEEGLQFSWDPAVSDSGKRWNDQTMMMAYIPSLREAVYLLNGARRTEGADILKLPRFKDAVVIETYISFIAANHKSISDSVYTGQLIWKGL